MIKIGKPVVLRPEGGWRLSADLDVDGRQTSLWFETDEEYSQYLCHERCDAFVLGLLHYAMKYGHDIQSVAPMTDRLYEQLTGQFLPAFYKVNSFTKDRTQLICGRGYPLRIICPTAPEVEHAADAAYGTGVSCGVDSMHVFAKHPEITHGCIWNGHGITYQETKSIRDQAWQNLKEQAKRFTDHVGVKLVVGNTNFDRGCLPGLQWDGMTTQGNLFCIYSLQKLWKVYYVASDCGIENFRFKISLNEDPAHYEYFLFPWISMARMSVRMDGAEYTRVEKVRDLIDYPPAQEFLNTCWGAQEGHRNCSYKCVKCMRTMLNLHCFGALDRFSRVYDVEYFRTNYHQYIAELYRGWLQHDFFMLEMKPYFAHIKVPLGVKLRAMLIVARKAFLKACRLGKTSHRFSAR